MTTGSFTTTATERTHATVATHWAQHLMAPELGGPGQPALSSTEAARVQRHRDQLLAALQAHDRHALMCAKHAVLQDAFCQGGTPTDRAPVPGSPAMRSALRDLSWRMAGLLLPRSPSH